MKSKHFLKHIRPNFLLAVTVFTVSLSVYILTLSPSIGIGDSGELATAAYTLGVAHPPGFPLYVILGKLFTFLPFGSIAMRVNFMSAFFGALTVSILALCVNRMIRNVIIAGSAALVLAFSEIFWSQSVVAEVYTLNAFFVALLLYLLLLWSRSKKPSILLWFSFLYGLSITNHTMMALFGPLFAAFIFWQQPVLMRRPLKLLQLLGLWAAGLSVYGWMMLRSLQFPALNWTYINNFKALVRHVGRVSYSDLSPGASLYSKIGLIINFIAELGNQFFYSTLLLAAIGLIYLLIRKKQLAVLTFGILFFNSVAIILLRAFGWGEGIHYSYRFYYLPSYMMIVVWLAIALRYLLAALHQADRQLGSTLRRSLRFAFYAIIISLPVSFALANYERNDQSDFWFVEDVARAQLASMAPNSVYYFAYDGTLTGDTELFSVMYLRLVENVRPDIRIATEQNTFYREIHFDYPPEYYTLDFNERRAVFLELLATPDRPFALYTNLPIYPGVDDVPYTTRSVGLLHQVFDSPEEAKAARLVTPQPVIRNIQWMEQQDEFLMNGLLSHYYYNQAVYYLNQGDEANQEAAKMQAVDFSNLPIDQEFQNFIKYRKHWLEDATELPDKPTVL